MKFTNDSPAFESHRLSYESAFRDHAGSIFSQTLYELIGSLAAGLQSAAANSTVTFGIAGAQGSGKSTMTRLLALMLKEMFQTDTAVLSLDDFYLTRSQRLELAATVHPMLSVRGVPGTHDTRQLATMLAALKAGGPADLPIFDKSRDDRSPQVRHQSAARVILIEGWCWGARPEPEDKLLIPVNSLERERDPDGIWRHFVNEQLSQYQSVFETDGSLYFRVPSIEAVYRWRWQQEQDLIASRGPGPATLSQAEVHEFVAYYERLTRWMAQDMPGRADVCAELRDDHTVGSVKYR